MGQQMDKEAEPLICCTRKSRVRPHPETGDREREREREGDRKRNTDTGKYSKEEENKRG